MSRKRRQSLNDGNNAPTNTALPKRRRQYTEEDSKLAAIYENLASESKDDRMKAAKELILKLSPENGPSVDSVEKALTRLVRGLCSGRKAARFGFFVALTELLRQIYDPNSKEIQRWRLDVNGLIDLVTERTQPEANVSGQERRDHLLGRLFGYNAIMQSSIFTRPNTSIQCWNKLLDHIYGIARDKPVLREECGMILCDIAKTMDSQPQHELYIREMLQRLSSFNIARTPEGVAIWLTIRSTFPEDILPSNTWDGKDPLSKNERKTLANTLRENFYKAPEDGDQTQKIKGTPHSSPSFAWDVVMANMLQRQAKKHRTDGSHSDKSDFAKFWIDVVDENLFLADASLERKSWGFQIFTKLISTAPDWAIFALFSPNLMRSLINHQKNSERFLHNSAKISLDAIQSRVKTEPGLAATITIALTSKHGSINFDQLTKTKTLETILHLADDEASEKIVKHFQALIIRPESQERSTVESQRQMIGNMLLNVVKGYKGHRRSSIRTKKDGPWLHTLLAVLVEHAYFIPSQSARTAEVPLPAISDASRTMFRDKVSSCLTHLIAHEHEPEVSFPYLIVTMIRRRMQSHSVQLILDADKAILQTLNQAHHELDALFSKKASPKKKDSFAQAFILLYSLTIIQVYNGDPDAVVLLEELDTCCKSIFEKTDSTIEHSLDMLVEILLTFLAKPSLLFRKLAGQVFATFTAEVTWGGLNSMIDILEKEENLTGQQELFEQGMDELDGGNSSDDAEDASDIEMIEDSSSSGEDDSDAESDGEQDDESDTGSNVIEDADDEELAIFDAKLAEMLKTSNKGTELDSSSSDSDMDDEQMMALDPHLTKIFQERTKAANKKKDKKDAKTTVINFKVRVLDLLLIYVKNEHANPLALQLILPVLRRVRSNTSRQIAEKSFNLLKEYFASSSKSKDIPELDSEDELWTILKGVHAEANMDGSKMHCTACSKSSLFIAKVLVALKKSNYEKVEDVYSATQKGWYMEANSKVHPTLFTDWINWSISARKQKE